MDWFALDPVIGRSNGIGVSKKPPHPNAALLLYEYMINDAQPLIVKMNYLSPSRKVESLLKNIRIRYIYPTATLMRWCAAPRRLKRVGWRSNRMVT